MCVVALLFWVKYAIIYYSFGDETLRIIVRACLKVHVFGSRMDFSVRLGANYTLYQGEINVEFATTHGGKRHRETNAWTLGQALFSKKFFDAPPHPHYFEPDIINNWYNTSVCQLPPPYQILHLHRASHLLKWRA